MSSDDGELIFQYNTYNNTDRNEWVPSEFESEEEQTPKRGRPSKTLGGDHRRPKKQQSPAQYMQIKDENHIYDHKYTQKELKSN